MAFSRQDTGAVVQGQGESDLQWLNTAVACCTWQCTDWEWWFKVPLLAPKKVREVEQYVHNDDQNIDVLFIIGDWNAKVGSQETPGVTGKFCLGVQNEAGQRLREFCQENSLLIANTLFQKHKRRLYTWTSLEISSRKLEIPREHFMQRWAQWRAEMVWT